MKQKLERLKGLVVILCVLLLITNFSPLKRVYKNFTRLFGAEIGIELNELLQSTDRFVVKFDGYREFTFIRGVLDEEKGGVGDGGLHPPNLDITNNHDGKGVASGVRDMPLTVIELSDSLHFLEQTDVGLNRTVIFSSWDDKRKGFLAVYIRIFDSPFRNGELVTLYYGIASPNGQRVESNGS